MVYPVSAGSGGIKIRTELLEKEKMYHCLLGEKLMLVYMDGQDMLNCYEVEDKELVSRVRKCTSREDAASVIESFGEQLAAGKKNDPASAES